ncbi:MAG: hypothetical protein OXT64_04200 [Gammaproteobacteria bacterium]|nr:hypothetical protein [Gammaproteobacteria bacterium]MDE0450145.1 hypothetical protein [Gammaproteobacteria bacterium]
MNPVVKKEPCRLFKLRVGENTIMSPDTICEPRKDNAYYKLEREGDVVARFKADTVSGWWLESTWKPTVAAV